jgi:hypothetical protein
MVTVSVFPPVDGGLHSGTPCHALEVVWTTRVPPLTGGLHCGQITGGSGAAAGIQVLPPFNGGLHCGNSMNVVGSLRGALMLPPI